MKWGCEGGGALWCGIVLTTGIGLWAVGSRKWHSGQMAAGRRKASNGQQWGWRGGQRTTAGRVWGSGQRAAGSSGEGSGGRALSLVLIRAGRQRSPTGQAEGRENKKRTSK